MTATIDRTLAWLSALTPQSLQDIDHYYAVGARLRDPLVDASGTAAIKGVFERMFVMLGNPHIMVVETIVETNQVFVIWLFEFDLSGKPMCISGSSHLRFDVEGRIFYHRNYWDIAGEIYEKYPLLGPVLRWIKRKIR